MPKPFIAPLFAVLLIGGLVGGSIAGHNYHGYGMRMNEMSEIDSNADGTITFDEFSAPTVEKLSIEEWDEFLRVHGLEKKSEG